MIPAILRDIQAAAVSWSGDNALRLSAALAYYALLSVTPLILILIALAALFYGEAAAGQHVGEQIRGLAGNTAGDAMLSLMRSAHQSRSGAVAVISGTVLLFIGASGVFGELKAAMNSIWGVTAAPGKTVRSFFGQRLISMLAILAVGSVLITAVAASAILSAVISSGYIPVPGSAARLFDFTLTLLVTMVLFLALFVILPDVRIRWADVWLSAALTAFLFTLGKFLIALYLGTTGVASSYGAAGSVIVIQLWVYYSACILFFGVELTKATTLRRRGVVTPRGSSMRAEDLPKE
ncbi:MAG: YihY/virulence factor BrkB family protein [Chthoniobacteraceae bacterium]